MGRKKLIKSEVVKIFDTTRETLRHYENLGLIHPEIDGKNYRYYDYKDLRKLRQIFFLREMEVPLDQIGQLEKGDSTREKYLHLLTHHHKNLEQKLERQRHCLKNISRLMYLLRQNPISNSCEILQCRERYFYRLDTSTIDDALDYKSYFDMFSALIELKIYTERSFILTYPYRNLSDPRSIEATQSLEVPDSSRFDSDLIIRFPEGSYLSVFYLFRDGDNQALSRIYDEIENHLKSYGLKRIHTTVIEIEHPELSIMFDENENIYELQIQVGQI